MTRRPKTARRRVGDCWLVKLFFSDPHVIPLPAGHRFPASKYALLRQRLDERAELAFNLIPAPAITDDEIRRVHTEAFLKHFSEGTWEREDVRRLGLPWSEGLALRSRHSAGGTLAAARASCTEGLAVNLAGGTHHAFADRPEGFCVLNDTVIAARTLQDEGVIRNVLVIDTDVHQGNGTASVVRGDASIFAFSIHGAKNYPFVKVNGDLDLALPDGTKDDAYLQALDIGVQRALKLSAPDLIFFLAGADPYRGDRFSRWDITKQGLRRRDEFVLQLCRRRELPVVITLAGGYSRNIEETVDIHEQTMLTALDVVTTA